MINTINIRIPNTIIGLGAINSIDDLVKDFNPSKILVITDPNIFKSGIIEPLQSSLETAGYKFDIFDGCIPDPPISSIAELSKKIKEDGYDLLIGVGGGSAMDTTKVASQVAACDDVSVYDLVNHQTADKTIPKILIPTTAGTGSEWSNVGMVSDDKAGMSKKAVVSAKNFADAVIVDPELTRNLPQGVTADTGMDGLVHAIEAYTSCSSNIISDMFAETALKLICENLPLAFSKGKNNIEARYKVSIAASLAMCAATIAGIGMVHIAANPVQKRAHISHGQSCIVLLPYVMDFHLITNPLKFAKIAELMGEKINDQSTFDAAAKSIEAVRKLSIKLGMPQKLSDIGIEEKDIPEMVDEIHPHLDFLVDWWNPREVSTEDTTRIYEIAIRGERLYQT